MYIKNPPNFVYLSLFNFKVNTQETQLASKATSKDLIRVYVLVVYDNVHVHNIYIFLLQSQKKRQKNAPTLFFIQNSALFCHKF